MVATEDYSSLVSELGQILGRSFEEDAARNAPGLEQALESVGLTVEWLHCGPEVATQQARADLPLLTWISHSAGGLWVVAHGRRFRRVRLREVGQSESTWVDLESRVGQEARNWARVLPVMPASPLGKDLGAVTPIQRLMGLLRAEQGDIGAVVVFAVAVGTLSLATPLAIQLLINWLAFGALLQPIVTLAIALVLCLTLVGAMRLAQRHAVEIIQRRIFARAVSDLSARLSRVRKEALDGVYGPELANRFFDVLTLQKAANTLLLDGLAAALQAGVGLILLAFYHPLLLVFDLVVVLLVSVVLFGLSRGAEASAILESKKKYAVAAWLEEIARQPLVFKFGGGPLGPTRTDRLIRDYLGARVSHFRVFFRQYIGMQFVAVVVPASLLLMTGWLVLEGELTLGQLVAAEFIVASALAGVAKFTGKLETLYDLLAGIDKLGTLFDLPLEAAHGPENSATGAAAVDVEEATYSYGAGEIGPFNLAVPSGGRLAILGGAGSGKSTLAQLILGVRTPNQGRVLRDGVPLESLRPAPVFAEGLLVSPEGLLATSVRDNLTLGKPILDEVIWEALQKVELEAVVRALPDGLDTVLTPSGTPLCHVHALGLMVARVFLSLPRLVVVDGVLDGVPETQRQVWFDALSDPQAPWSLVVTTHDAALAARCTQTVRLGGS